MYLLRMRCGRTAACWVLVATALGCRAPIGPSQSDPKEVRAKASTGTAGRAPRRDTRHQTAVAWANQTARYLQEFGFPVDLSHLDIIVATRAEFVAGLTKNATYFEVPGQYIALSALARLFGMQQGRNPTELKAIAASAVGEATIAYYDHVTQSLVIRDDADTRMLSLETLLAHELAHAYQDQHQGGLDEYIRLHNTSLDAMRAAHGVLEGQAVVIGTGVEWYRRGVGVERLDPDIADVSVGRLSSGESFSVIYEAGRRFMLTRYREGGWSSIEDAYQRPPSSTEQLLHPAKFRRDLPSEVFLPESPRVLQNYPVVFQGTVGELLLYNRLLLVAGDLYRARVGAAGWDGDLLRVHQLPDGGYALWWRIQWDRARDAAQFEAIIEKAIRDRSYVRLWRDGRTTDLVYAEVKSHFAALAQSIAKSERSRAAVPFDAESTAAVEAAWSEQERRRPYAENGRWFVPDYGLSFRIPTGYLAVTLRGVELLVARPKNGFANNISLVYEQDLFDGNIERYLAETQRDLRETSQRWIAHRIVSVDGKRAAVIELEVPGEENLISIAMLVLPLRGRWVTISCACVAQPKGEAMRLVQEVLGSLRVSK